jgi:hypothetical protein
LIASPVCQPARAAAPALTPSAGPVAAPADLKLEVDTESATLPGDLFDLSVEIVNEGTVGSGPIELAVRIPPEARLVDASPSMERSRGTWSFVTLREVPPSRTVRARLTLQSPAEAKKFPLEVRVHAPGAAVASLIWRDDIRMRDRPAEPMVDLKIGRSDLRGRAELGDKVAYTLTIANRGTLAARDTLLKEWSTGLRLLELQPSQGAARIDLKLSDRAEVMLGELAPGATATVDIIAYAVVVGKHSSKSEVTSAGAELLPSDNQRFASYVIHHVGEAPEEKEEPSASGPVASAPAVAPVTEGLAGRGTEAGTKGKAALPPARPAASVSRAPRHYPLPIYAFNSVLGPAETPRADASGALYFIDRDRDPPRSGISRISPAGALQRFWARADEEVKAFDIAADGAVWFLTTGSNAKLFRQAAAGPTELVREWAGRLLCAPLRCIGADEVLVCENPFSDKKERNTVFRVHRDGRILATYAAAGTHVADIVPLPSGEVALRNGGEINDGQPSIGILDTDGRVLADMFPIPFRGSNLVADARGNLFTAAGEGKESIKQSQPHLFNRVIAINPDGRIKEFPIKSGDRLGAWVGVRTTGALLLGNVDHKSGQGVVTELKIPENRSRVLWRSEPGWIGSPTFFSTPAGDWVVCFEENKSSKIYRLTVQLLPD